MTDLQQVIVMAFGALVAVGGLVLLFLRNESGQNEITIAGQTIKLSTPGLAVLLVGCGIFVLPFFLPTMGGGVFRIDTLGEDSSAKQDPQSATIRPVAMGSQESEPNDRLTEANVIQFGSTALGVLRNDKDRDVYQFRTGPTTERVRVIVRKEPPAKNFWLMAQILNVNESALTGDKNYWETPVSFGFDAEPGVDYFVRLWCESCVNAHYELVLRDERRN